ncbi:MAG: hypothetical protein IH613_16780 [Desulfuromonadales bacterium]|nr:hypothetical protein [Desulfuromonadales bacterium]
MKIGLKLLILWAASITLFLCAGLATWLGMDVMDGVSGLTIRFFLGYCAIIVVSQVFSAFAAVCQLYRDITEKQPESIRVLFR